MSNYDDNIKLEQYKAYIQKTDKFTDRSFNTNKYLIVIIIVLFVAICVFSKIVFRFFTASMMFSLLGMGVSFLWWSNVDVYNIFNKIKLKNVIDKMEEELPFKCHLMEKEAFDKIRDEKKAIVFSDMQKLLAMLAFLMFMVILVTDYMHFYFCM